MRNIFTEHPHSINETYFQHLIFAAIFGCNMLIGGMACLIHAFFPFLFEKTGSHFLLKMTHFFVERMPDKRDQRLHMLSELLDKKKTVTEKI